MFVKIGSTFEESKDIPFPTVDYEEKDCAKQVSSLVVTDRSD